MIGLDGADSGLVGRCIANGSAPNLAALQARGRTKRLSAPAGLTDDAIWACFQYGVGVGEHGRYNNIMRQEDGRFGQSHLAEATLPTFWDELSSNGFKVAIFDVPKCHPPRPTNGIHLADWLVHGRYSDKPQSYPKSLADEILDRYGPAACSCDCRHPPAEEAKVRESVDTLRNCVARKLSAGLHYLTDDFWDLFVIGFKDIHCCCHGFWDLMDPGHPAYDPQRTAQLGDPATLVLEDIDRAVGDLVAAAGADADVVVFSTSDFAPNGTLSHLLPVLVARINQHLARHGEDASEAMQGWRCQMLPYTDGAGALRVLHDRRISRGSAANAGNASLVVAEIESLLGDLTDADTGAKMVSSFSRPSRELQGSRSERLPDLLIHYARCAAPRTIVSSRLGRISRERPSIRPGNHIPGGFLITMGEAACKAADQVKAMEDFAQLASSILYRRGGGARIVESA